MNILEIGISKAATGFVNYSDFVYAKKIGNYTLATYWTDTFGAADESTDKIVRVKTFTRAVTTHYTKAETLADCQDTEQSFFFDFADQTLYVHFEHDQNPLTDDYQYTIFNGYNDSKGIVYIDDIQYLPLLQSVPQISQQASIVGYDKQAYIDGSVVLTNAKGKMDYLIEENVYGNDADLFYLDDDLLLTDGKLLFTSYDVLQKELTADDEIQVVLDSDEVLQSSIDPVDILIQLASFYIEKPDFTLQTVTISMQDKRKAENPTIPKDTFLSTDYPDIEDDYIGDPIPLVYGPVRELKAVPLNGEATGDVNFKVAELLTSFGTIQVLIDDVWTTKTATASDLSTAIFTLASADARETSGAIRKVKLVNPIGEAITYASDVIKKLNLKFLGIPYDSSFYNTEEWESEETNLTTIGVVIDKEKELAEWIKDIQGGANIGFRYEITPDGKRTIRIRDNSRASDYFIPSVSIFNNNLLPVRTDPKTVFAEIKVEYFKSYQSGKMLSVLNDDFKSSVIGNYKQRNRLTVPTFLTNSTDADSRALTDATDFQKIRPNAILQVVGKKYLSLKIYQVITVVLEKTDRTYFGTVDALILKINPEGKTKTNNIEVRILS